MTAEVATSTGHRLAEVDNQAVRIDESHRVSKHPGIVFRDGPTGRRAALSGGPDVSEVVGAVNAIRDEEPDLEGDSLVGQLCGVTGLNRTQVIVALRYYADYTEEVDDRVAANRDVAERAFAARRR